MLPAEYLRQCGETIKQNASAQIADVDTSYQPRDYASDIAFRVTQSLFEETELSGDAGMPGDSAEAAEQGRRYQNSIADEAIKNTMQPDRRPMMGKDEGNRLAAYRRSRVALGLPKWHESSSASYSFLREMSNVVKMADWRLFRHRAADTHEHAGWRQINGESGTPCQSSLLRSVCPAKKISKITIEFCYSITTSACRRKPVFSDF